MCEIVRDKFRESFFSIAHEFPGNFTCCSLLQIFTPIPSSHSGGVHTFFLLERKMKRQREVSVKGRGKSSTGDSEDAWATTTSLKFTGAKAGTRLLGCRPRTKGAIIVLDNDVHPLKSCLEYVRKQGQMDLLIARCLQIPCFHSREEVEQWFAEATDDKTFLDLDIGVTVHEVGKSQFLKIPNVVGQHMTVGDLENEFPRPPKTKDNKKHTLVMHIGGWSAWGMQTTSEQKPCKQYLDFDELYLNHHIKTLKQTKKKWVNVNDYGICYESFVRPIALHLTHDLGAMSKLLLRMTSGELKSLMQKLLRKSPAQVSLGTEVYDSRLVLNQLIDIALLHKGGFVPQIQTHVSGLVSLFKRLAVTMVEDAWVDDQSVHSLLTAACIAQQDPDFYPSSHFVVCVKQWAQAAMASKQALAWNMERGKLYTKSTLSGTHLMTRSAAMLRHLKSFSWDLDMFEDVAHMDAHTGALAFHRPQSLPIPTMPVEVYLDHHVDPSVVYYAGPRAVHISMQMYDSKENFGDMDVLESSIFAPFSRAIFHQVSGTNPRRPNKYPLNNEFIDIVTRAQTQLFIEMHANSILGITNQESKLPHVKEPETLQYEFSSSCLAAAIGHINVKVNHKPYFAFITRIHEDMTCEWNAVRVPTRDETNTQLEESVRLKAISMGRNYLAQHGAKINSVWFPQGHLIYEDNKLFLVKETCEVLGEKMRKMKTLETPVFHKTFTTCLNTDHLCERIRSMPLSCARRLMRLTEGFVTRIVFPKLTRSGGSDDIPSHFIDPELFQLLLGWYPLLQLNKVREFEITEPLLWYWLRENVLVKYCRGSLKLSSGGWKFTQDKEARVLTNSQSRALLKLQKAKRDASLVVMDTGSGKTLVLMRYLIWLQSQGKLPNKVLVTTPSSALDNVHREISMFCKAEIRDMRMGYRSDNPLSDFVVSIITHDHLRLVKGIWDNCIPQCMFVIDEFHQCFANTLRTKCAQDFAATALRRIGLSATPVLNNDIYQLTNMLKPLCAFEPTPSNFFVAYSEVVQEYEPMPFVIENKQHFHEMTNAEYFRLLPKALGGLNTQKLQTQDLNTLMNYAMHESSRHMVELTLQCIAQGRCVFLIGKHQAHVESLHKMLCEKMKPEDIYCVTKGDQVITLTDKTVSRPKSSLFRRYKVVIVPLRISAGYSMTICDTMISSVDFSNAAVREQLRGRIKRLCSSHNKLYYHTVVCGIVHTFVLKRYAKSDSFAAVLRDMNGELEK